MHINTKLKYIVPVLCALLALPLFSVIAKTPPAPPSPSATPSAPVDLARKECSDRYRFGSVVFSFDQTSNNQVTNPGEKLKVTGTVKNNNEYPLPDGQVLVRVLRQDTKVEQRDWHPFVADIPMNGMMLLANESKPFNFEWTVPALAPAGTYRVEFFYQAAGRYSMAGLPFIANATGGSVLFTVKSAGIETAVSFDRSSVLLNGKPLGLRSVPPTLATDKPVTVSAKLKLENNNKRSVNINLTKKLYNWSDADQTKPLSETTEVVTLKPGQTVPVNFQWDKPVEGVYQLQLSAQPENKQMLPSLLKVRFPVGGDSPRLIFAGVGKVNADGSAEVVACGLNGTFGETNGSVTTKIEADGKVLSEKTDAISKTGMATILLPLTKEQLMKSFSVSAQATNATGVVTDKHTVNYEPSMFGFKAAVTPKNVPVTPVTPRNNGIVYGLPIVLLVLILVGGVMLYIKKRDSGINNSNYQ
ncbi:MAG: hypothetical protein Q7S57_04735 [bacterium]|nr:hypothetical protein [bacterium]